ncbi:MAG: DHH family phosphoesterase [Ruminococcus sp.]|nr:DHH family phosphoesterase [Ruminococcus sp.]
MKKKMPAALIIISILMLTNVIVSAAMLSIYSKKQFLMVIIPGVLFTLIYIGILIYMSKSLYRHISKMNRNLTTTAAEYMNSLPVPAAVIDDDGIVVWYNEFFKEKVAMERDAFGLDLRDYISIDIHTLKKGEACPCIVNGSYYEVTAKKNEFRDNTLYTLHFHDDTDLYNLQKKYNDTRQSMLIIMIDNYDDIMQNAKESEKAKTSVETEQLIENFMNGTDGIVKKVSSNTFLAIIEDCHLNKIIDEKFKILDGARNIKVDGKTPLTLSIGVGQGASNLAESETLAKQCLDMALGRGGDQAVLKTENGYRFFGGVSKGVEKKSRAKTRIIANTMQDLILNSDRVFVMGHRFGDLDSIGSAAGIVGAVRLMNKEAFVVVDRKKNLALQLVEMIEANVEEKIFISPNEAVDYITQDDLLIIVDTHNKDFIESADLYKEARQVVVIDHHRKTVNFIDNAVIFHHEPYASSASEMVTELIQYFKLDDDNLASCYAEALMAGIALDTKNFVMRTGVRTFEAAAFLRKIGADTVVVKSLFSSSIETYQRKTKIVSSAIIHNRCAIAITEMKSDDIRLICPQAADELLSITNVDASFVIFRTGDIINISARSLGAMNVQVIMECLGGGGHQTMAATQLENVTLQEADKLLRKAIDENTQ